MLNTHHVDLYEYPGIPRGVAGTPNLPTQLAAQPARAPFANLSFSPGASGMWWGRSHTKHAE